MADAVDPARALTSPLRASLSRLKHDVATSLSLCGRDFGRLGAELVAALDRTHARERATADALAHERAARGLLESHLSEKQRHIRVLCRVRPQSDLYDQRPSCVHVASVHELSVASSSPGDSATAKSFFFSRVFHEEQSQATVFQEVAPLVRSALDGHHACVLAYGQTGAGKTYTMEGCQDDRGLYDRAAALIWTTAEQQQHVYDFAVELQLVEIYNEEIYDLLARSDKDGGGSSSGRTTSSTVCTTGSVLCTTTSSAAGTNGGDRGSPIGASTVEIRHGGNGVYLKNVESVAVSSVQEFQDAIARSKSGRTAASIDRNNRSHTVLMIEIRRTSKASGETDSGRLVLVDLAGSERLLKTATTSALTVREAQHINKSLSAVGDVLSALLAKEKHVPFRNSKLTHLLQDSLSGSGNRTLLLVHVCPQSDDVNETINSLKFASRMSHIQMGKSQRTERAEIARLNGVVANQVSQIQALQGKLNAELELRKKYEKRLAEYRQDEHRRRSKGDEARRILQQMRTPSPPELPPPVSARRWSLYTRKYADRCARKTYCVAMSLRQKRWR
uniref:Kinesin-like protein n=1 Tax=Hyaloperonospora arabidopsidis (strain Emoy2) TaxID=559515 RepID=M4BDD9_HYAAE